MNASYRLLLLAWLLSLCVTARAGTAERQREIFRTAWQQAPAQRPDVADTATLRRYALYPYLQAERMRWALSRVAAKTRDPGLEARVRAFLTKHKGAPVTRELQRDWLRHLGEREAWAEFLEQAPTELSEPDLRCHGFSARLAAHDLDGLREELFALWLTQRDVPAACKPALAWLDTPERLSDAEVEQRARFAAQERQPLPASISTLPPERRALALFWQRLLANPEAGLKRFLKNDNLLAADNLPRPPAAEIGDALVQAFERLARQDSTRAGAVFASLLRHSALAEPQRAQLQRAHALGLAYDHDPKAIRQFDLPVPALDVLAHEWRVRAALLHGNWKQAGEWLRAMPEAQRQEPRWRYWHARTLEQRGDGRAAKTLYQDVSNEREYYGFLATERLGRKPDLRPQAIAEDRAEQQRLSGLSSMQRARELFLCELPELAAAEFRYAQRDLPPHQRAQAARLAAGWGWHEQAVLLLAELQMWDDLWLRFPAPYENEVMAATKETGVPADWLYTVLRTESLYNPRAISRADALGLMQLRLATARAVAQRAGLARPTREDLFEPVINIRLGAGYLREMHERFGGRWIFMLAAYNAGPQRVPGWRPDAEVAGDIWVENIPYNETRTYIQRALSNLVMTAWRRSGEPAAILPHLSPVTPAGDDAP